MDYNYIRMRNAAKNGNTELAEQYRKRYETGADINFTSHIIDYILILLTVVALILGVYTVHYSKSVHKSIDTQPTVAESLPDSDTAPGEDTE